MKHFEDHYFTEKTIATKGFSKGNPTDSKCMEVGQKIADRFGLRFDGWMEIQYVFTILKGLPNEMNTFMATTEETVLSSLKENSPNTLNT